MPVTITCKRGASLGTRYGEEETRVLGTFKRAILSNHTLRVSPDPDNITDTIIVGWYLPSIHAWKVDMSPCGGIWSEILLES